MSTEDILIRIKEEGVQFITLQFTDLLGVVKEIIIPAAGAATAINSGVWFDGSSVEGFARIQESDLFLKPDLSTYSVVPWLAQNGKTARLICDIYRPDGRPFEGDPRSILKKIINQAHQIGLEPKMGPEAEFYLFRDETQQPPQPIDYSGYFDFSSHEGYKFIKEVASALGQFGIEVETSHHEVGQGQYEIDFKYGPALEIADKVLTLKYTVKKIAQMYGLRATFIPKPIRGAAGSGMHIHQSLFDRDGRQNLFYHSDNQYRLSSTAYHFIAGQMRHIKAMSAILCPTVNSYKRLISGFEAPVYITWAGMNRSALIRIPRFHADKPEAARIELRCPDPTCNPYLAFAVMIASGLEGIKEKLPAPTPVEENVYNFNGDDLNHKKIATLPTSLKEALTEMKNDYLVAQVLGDDLLEKYFYIKNKEWNEYSDQVTDWEIKKYSAIY
ncbi:MAG TPA: glutamine synthetase family protein [bacterium]|nr:glutamine synthetase family protein [bacterium]HNS33698.1 glutamine synthetase family protein [bacterium]HOH67508.1 glutamine synthetase family protein [bacterium]HPW39693.1 glutamine synthetase family protein [bacterium]HQA64073.1 glutamine synthetase family protein [bacterium]